MSKSKHQAQSHQAPNTKHKVQSTKHGLLSVLKSTPTQAS